MEEPPQGLRIPPKILYVDIEYALMSVYLYDLYVPNKRLSPSFIVQHSYIINWAAAWIGPGNKVTGKIMSGVVTQREARQQSDKRIVSDIWSLMDEADYICGHNSDAFDLKILNWRFMVHGLGFPAKYRKLDTFKMAGKYTRPPSRGLESLSLILGGDHKHGLRQGEWMEIVRTGNPKLLAKSDRYCRGDVKNGVIVLKRFVDAIEASGVQVYR